MEDSSLNQKLPMRPSRPDAAIDRAAEFQGSSPSFTTHKDFVIVNQMLQVWAAQPQGCHI
jgi:hypothetical protein